MVKILHTTHRAHVDKCSVVENILHYKTKKTNNNFNFWLLGCAVKVLSSVTKIDIVKVIRREFLHICLNVNS